MRVFRLIATPVLLLGLVGFLIWGALWGWNNLTAPLPTPSPTPCVTRTSEVLNIRNVTVRVFNGGFTSGLGRRQAQRLSDAGFIVQKTSNTDERIKGTVIRTNKAYVPATRLVSSYFVDPKVEFDDRVDGTVDVLVGTDFKGETPKEKWLGEVSTGKAGTVCLPPTPKPSDTLAPTPQPSPAPKKS